MRAPLLTFGLLLSALCTAGPLAPVRAENSAAQALAEKFARASAQAVEPAPAASDTDNDRKAALEAEREAETLRLAERLRAARRAKAEALDREEQAHTATIDAARDRLGALSATAAPVLSEAAPRPKIAVAAAPQVTQAGGSNRVTVLLALNPGTYGIRRFDPTGADPVLCVGDTCYVSQGADVAAKALPRTVALGTGNTLGGRAGACRHQLTCVFRGVDLYAGQAELQPVDLHVLRHDRRELTLATADHSCATASGRLTCLAPVRSATYQAWIVPEAVAQTAGGGALTAAVTHGLAVKAASAL